MRTLIIAALMLITASASAQQPLPKVGSCSSGYRESGGYCSPISDRAPDAIVKAGQCPSNWAQSGAYCIRIGGR